MRPKQKEKLGSVSWESLYYVSIKTVTHDREISVAMEIQQTSI